MGCESLSTERFSFLRAVGAGAMGIVYEARDGATGERVAIKTLHEIDGHALYRLKNEFRQVKGIVHDNLVRLRELVVDRGHCFLVMDFIDGVDVVSHVRGSDRDPTPATVAGKTAPPRARRVTSEVAIDYAAIRRITGEIAGGLHALHEAGCVHRDIKPSNVLIRTDGRAVILDFGLVVQQVGIDSTDGALVGTLPYMAPEQAIGHRATPAADCYALGVMLFEMLTGRWPHRGDLMEMIAAKQTFDAPPPSQLVPAVPADLDRLSGELLQKEPQKRPSAHDVWRRLDTRTARPRRRAVTRTASMGNRFVGRFRELGELLELVADTRTGNPSALWLRGDSGVGKSSLLRRFSEEVRERHGDAVILHTCCHEHELLPFKTVDGIVDALSGYLRSLPAEEAASLLPRHASFLRVAFPVLARVDAIARAPYPVRPVEDPHERRLRAFASLRELLGRIAERRTLVLTIDDVQWGDDDSAQLLQEALRPPDAPSLFLLLASRPQGNADTLVRMLEAFGTPVHRMTLDVLSEGESTELARRLLDAADLGEKVSAAAIAEEAQGNPLMVHELVRHARSALRTPPVHPVLNEAIRLRIASLPAPAQSALRMLCLAGAPLSMDVLGIATALAPIDLSRAIAPLVSESLVRSSSILNGALEPYHDRIREAVIEALGADQRSDSHRRLASALEGSALAAARPELLLHHFQACGRLDVAAEYAERAARQASDSRAFGRAAELLELALRLHPRDADSERPRRIALAEALGRAGRLLDSAETYLTAAQGAERHQSFQLKCRSLEQFLRGGALERGHELAGEVLVPLGIRLARGPRRATLDLLWQRALLRLRGPHHAERPIERVPPADLELLDVLWSVSSSFAFGDPMVSRALAARFTRLALRAGEPQRIALALSSEAAYRCIPGAGSRATAHRFLAESMAIATAVDTPYLIGMVHGADGISHFLCGEYSEALIAFERAIELLRSETTNARWEIDVAETFRAATLVWLGRLRELDQLVSRLVTEAAQSGDQYLAVGIGRSSLVWLARDRAREGREYVEDARRITTRQPRDFGVFDVYYAVSLSNIDLYEGSADAAWQRVETMWPELRRSRLLGVQSVNTEAVYVRIRTAIALAARSAPPDRARLLRIASQSVGMLRGSKVRQALAAVGRLMIACVEGASIDARAVATAVAQLDACDLDLHAASARLRFGERLGDAEMIAEARAYMARERVVDATALSSVAVPV